MLSIATAKATTEQIHRQLEALGCALGFGAQRELSALLTKLKLTTAAAKARLAGPAVP